MWPHTGLGGFSAGAIAARAKVVLGVDHDSKPLKIWGANVPTGRPLLRTLGPGGDAIAELPAPATSLHLHLSPPCHEFSSARSGSTPASDVEAAVAMMRWALDLVLERGDVSWSLENVSVPATRGVLQDYVSKYPDRVAFASLDAADFGAPQTRVRLIAGPPSLVKTLQQQPAARRLSVRDAFAARGLEVGGPCFKNQTRGRDGAPCKRSVEEQSFTVCASHALTWCDSSGKTIRVMSPSESAILMGFPTSWRLPHGSRDAQRAVGNAMCVHMSRAIVDAATSVYTGEVLSSLPTTTAFPTESTPAQFPTPPTPTPAIPAELQAQMERAITQAALSIYSGKLASFAQCR